MGDGQLVGDAGRQERGQLVGAVVEVAAAHGESELGLAADPEPGQALAVADRLGRTALPLTRDHGHHPGGDPVVEADPPGGGLANVLLEELADGVEQLDRRGSAVKAGIRAADSG